MKIKRLKDKHDAIMRSKDVRDKISKTMRAHIQKNGFSKEHRKNLSLAQQNRRCFIKNGKHTYASLNDKQKVEQLLIDGWELYQEAKAKNTNIFATRSISCYCILDTGERFDFESIIKAGKWWYDNYKPFGEKYSVATYQRKIEASILGKEIVFGNKTHKNHKKISNITWYSEHFTV